MMPRKQPETLASGARKMAHIQADDAKLRIANDDAGMFSSRKTMRMTAFRLMGFRISSTPWPGRSPEIAAPRHRPIMIVRVAVDL
jgi:hypothetical protein